MEFSKLILENIKECILIVENNTIKFSNVNGLTGKRVYEFVHESYIDVFVKAMSELKGGAINEFEIEVLVKPPEGRLKWADINCKKAGDLVILTVRDITRMVSLETVLRAAVDVSRLHADLEMVQVILQKYFPSATLCLEGCTEDMVVTETIFDGVTLTTPIIAGGEIVGSLSVELPEWFEVDEEIIDAFERLAADVAKTVVMQKAYNLIIKSINNLREAINSFAVLVDGIRNPLTAIQCLAETNVDRETSAKIKREVERVVKLIRSVENSWRDLERAEGELRNALRDYLFSK